MNWKGCNAMGKSPRQINVLWHPLFLLFLLLGTPQFLLAEGAEEMKKTEQEIREQMIKISAELGVACTECHMVTNFKDNQKEAFKVAAQHIKIVQILKSSGLNGQKGQPEASCYMCHRGQLRYTHKMSSVASEHKSEK